MFLKDLEVVKVAIKRVEEATENDNLNVEDHIIANYERAGEEVWHEMGSLGKIHNLAV